MDETIQVRRRGRRTRSRKGAMLVLVALVATILMAAAAFSVDIAYMFLAREQLYVATDAAAKAAVTGLSQGQSQSTAIQTGITCAAANKVCGQSLSLTSSNIALGGVTYVQNGLWTFNAAATTKTAAQVTASAPPVSLFFGPVLGLNTFTPTKRATAAFLRNKWCLVIDRSASMSFDMGGTDWTYPSGTWGSAGNYGQPTSYQISHPNSKPLHPYNFAPSPTASRWYWVRTATTTFLSAAGSASVQNQVGLVTFADSATSDCTFSTNYTPITTALDNYGDDPIIGGTNLASGLQAAFTMFTNTNDGTPWNKVIIVLSDGQWNEGSDPLTLVNQANTNGIVIHTVALLSNNTTMTQLAAQTGGQNLLANSGAALQQAFQKLANTIPVILIQ